LLPYAYVLNGILQLNKIQQEELHNLERPVSYLAWQNAEINRDRKKQRKPYKLDDFYFYSNKELANLPEPKYGAAAMALITKKMFPSWALFVYKDLKDRANDALPPEVLCLQCDDAILLAPNIEQNSITGMLIASESASGQIRTMTSPCGLIIEAQVPKINNKYEATEEKDLRLLRVIKRPGS
jgi:hypothetical protein